MMSSRSERSIQEMKQDFLERLFFPISYDIFLCDSLLETPIEKAMALALLFADYGCDWEAYGQQRITEGDWECFKDLDKDSLVIQPQRNVGKYRVDLAIRVSVDGRVMLLAVECDGHDFHHATKAQVERDKKRDRFLAAEGYKVLRFPGSVIYRDVESCANEVVDIVQSFIGGHING